MTGKRKQSFGFGTKEDFQQFLADEEAKKVTTTMADQLPVAPQEAPETHIIGALGYQVARFSIPGKDAFVEVSILRLFENGGRFDISASAYPDDADPKRPLYEQRLGSVASFYPHESSTLNSMEEVLEDFIEDVEDELYVRLPQEFVQDIRDKNTEMRDALAAATEFSYSPHSGFDPDDDEDDDGLTNLVWSSEDASDDYDDLYDADYCDSCGSYNSSSISGMFIPGGDKYEDSVLFTPPQGCFSGGEFQGSVTELRAQVLEEIADITDQEVVQFAELIRQSN